MYLSYCLCLRLRDMLQNVNVFARSICFTSANITHPLYVLYFKMLINKFWRVLPSSPRWFQRCHLKDMGLVGTVQIWMWATASLEFKGIWEVETLVLFSMCTDRQIYKANPQKSLKGLAPFVSEYRWGNRTQEIRMHYIYFNKLDRGQILSSK